MVGLFFRKRKKPNYEHIAQLERENGLDDGTFSDEWVEEMQERLDRAGVGTPPKKRELFKAPILEKKTFAHGFVEGLTQQHRQAAVSASSYSPNLHQVQRNPYGFTESKIVIARG